MKRANFLYLNGIYKSGRDEYLKDIKQKKIQHRVVSFDEKAKSLFGTIVLSDNEAHIVEEECLKDIERYLDEEQNVFYVARPFEDDRIKMLKSVKRYCSSNLIKCWFSFMTFPIACEDIIKQLQGEEMTITEICMENEKYDSELPNEHEGWNEILVNQYFHNKIIQDKIHNRLIG